jgi:hypothetical protein
VVGDPVQHVGASQRIASRKRFRPTPVITSACQQRASFIDGLREAEKASIYKGRRNLKSATLS